MPIALLCHDCSASILKPTIFDRANAPPSLGALSAATFEPIRIALRLVQESLIFDLNVRVFNVFHK